jgi:hypothetical protein
MVAQDGLVEPPTIRRWSKTLGELHRRIGHRFARSEARQRVKRYLLGLLGRVERIERLANGRGHRREGSAGGATPAELGQVGRGGGTRRSEGVRGGAFRRRGDGRTHRRRERLPEEGREERGGGPPGYTGTAGDTVNCQG